MDRENSIVQGKPKSWYNEKLLDTLLKRKTSKGQSMLKLDTQNVVSVPFDWEMKPGTPKHPQTETVPPLIKPSPAVESQTLVIRSFASAHMTTTTTSCFWIKSRKNYRQGKKMGKGNAKGGRGCVHGGDNIIDADAKGNHTPKIVEFSDVIVDSSSSSEHSRTCSSSSSVSTSSSSSNSNSTRSSNSSCLRSFAKELIKRSF